MNATLIDLLVAATVGLLYMFYVIARVLRARSIYLVLRLLICVAIMLFPVVGAAMVHVLICVSRQEPRNDRSLVVLGLIGASGTLLAYAFTLARIPVHDVYPASFILLGMLTLPTLGCFVLAKLSLLSTLPKWALLLAAVTVLNAVVHLVVYSEFADYGVPRERSGRHYLEINDRPTREISREEYYAFSGHLVRGYAAVLLAFYLVPALFFLLRKPDVEEEVAL